MDILPARLSAQCLGKYILLIGFVLTALHAGAAPPPNKPDTPVMAQWKASIPAIQDVLTRSGAPCPGSQLNIRIVDAAELTGESLSYALVDYCRAGAYTDDIIAMQMEQGKPSPARFRNANGKALEVGFAQGASVMHSVDTKLVPEKQAIYDIFSDNDGEGHFAKCGVKAYVWNASANAFVLSKQLTTQASRTYCQTLTPASTSSQVPFFDEITGISFRYPKHYKLTVGELDEHDVGLGYLGPITKEFAEAGGTRIVTVEPPAGSYPGTDYVNAFFTISINHHLSKDKCEQFADPLATRKLPGSKLISGIQFHGTHFGIAGLGHQFGGIYYHGYSRASCYELAYGVATAGYGAVDGMKPVDSRNVLSTLEKILRTVTLQ